MDKRTKAKIKWITIWAVGALLISAGSSIAFNDVGICFIIGMLYGVLAGNICIGCYIKEVGFDD